MASVVEWAAACAWTSEPQEAFEIQAYTFASATGVLPDVVTRPNTTAEASQSAHSWVGSGLQASVGRSVSTHARGTGERIGTSRYCAFLILPNRSVKSRERCVADSTMAAMSARGGASVG